MNSNLRLGAGKKLKRKVDAVSQQEPRVVGHNN